MRKFIQIDEKIPCGICGTNTYLVMTREFYFYLEAIKANIPDTLPICKKHANMYQLVFGDDDATQA